ncbi:MAG: DciA family protein [Pseudomonadota bacterium]
MDVNGEQDRSQAARYKRRLNDIYEASSDWKRGSVPVSDLLPKLIDPICARKGLASSALLAAWPSLAGAEFADCTMPDKIQWPHQTASGNPSYQGGVLVLRVDGPKAIYLQHEEHQIIQRVNQFFGFMAIERLKIVQAPINRTARAEKPALPPLSDRQEQKLRECIAEFEDGALDEAVLSLGRGVLRSAISKKTE